MADQLQFRGGTTTQVNAANVADRELIIDTTTKQIVLGSAKDRTVMADGATGNVAVSGLIESTTGGFKFPDGTTQTTAGGGGGGSPFSTDIVVNGLTVGRGAGNKGTNTSVGASALAANTSGEYQVAVGQLSLYNNVDGQRNTAIGRSALVGNVSGDSNIAIGESAGSALTGSNNTIIGSVAGTSSLSSTIILAAGSTERARCNSSGNWLIGGTTSAPNITLNSNGSADFAVGQFTINNSGNLHAQRTGYTSYVNFNSTGIFKVRGAATGGVLQVQNDNASGATTFEVTGAGNVTTPGIVESTSGGFKFPDGTTQTTASSGSSSLPSVGTAPNEIPLNQYLGQQAFVDEVGTVRPSATEPQANKDINFEYVSDTSIKIRMRGADGTVRSTTLTLS